MPVLRRYAAVRTGNGLSRAQLRDFEALHRGTNSGHRFEPREYFEEFNRHIPTHATPHQAATPDDVARYYPGLEEADKRWFCGWLNNDKQGNSVSPANLAKTRRLLGQHAHDFAQRRNQSPRWTSDHGKAITLVAPD